MTDFYSVLQRAIGSLPDKSGPQRRAVYDKARKALLKQLQSFDPPLPSADVTAQRLALEDAIRKIENEIARQIRTKRAAQGATSAANRPAGDPEQPSGRASEDGRQEGGRLGARGEALPSEADAGREAARAGEAEILENAVSRATIEPEPDVPSAPSAVAVAEDEPDPSRAAYGAADETPEEAQTRRPRGALRGAPSMAAVPGEPTRGLGREEVAPDDIDGDGDRGEMGLADDAGARDERLEGSLTPYEDEDGEARGAVPGRQRQRGAARRKMAERRSGRAARPTPASRETEVAEGGRRRPVVARVALPLVVLALFVGASYAAYTQRESLIAMIETSADGEASRAPVASPGPAITKNEDRLPSTLEGEETRPVTTTTIRPGADGGDGDAPGTAEEGPRTAAVVDGAVSDVPDPARTVGGEISPFDASPDDEVVPPANPATADDVAPDDAAEPQQDAALAAEEDLEAVDPEAVAVEDVDASNELEGDVAETREEVAAVAPADEVASGNRQQAVLYEEASQAGEPGSALAGQVEWSMVRQSIGGGEPEPVVLVNAEVPERDMEATLTIRQNTDGALPASHLIEITFEVPEDLEGGGVQNVPGVILKETEEARGEALRGAAARVSSGLFWIAMSEDENDRALNISLLRERDWIDIPILYESGRRAILTLRKGTDGYEAISAALEAWDAG